MAVTAERKEYPNSKRLPEADVAVIDRAASPRGRSRMDFVRDAAVRAAKKSLRIRGSSYLVPRAAPVPEMVELAKRPGPWKAGYEPKQ
ncbi:DUF1778 domain-containing protein [Rhizobium sp. NPDC090275]|uniref:type II toxin -antitoxin system TacA 1-like antitoxin n=1 Tax=Rhizobium sp. NPDC090275 TaxID=3364498 RepID=UPI00383BC751